MNIKKITVLLISTVLLLTGCGVTEAVEDLITDEKEVVEESSTIKGQTSSTVIKYTTNNDKLTKALDKVIVSKDGKKKSKEDTGIYLIQTPEGDYYPIATDMDNNYKNEKTGDYTKPSRQIYFTTENEKEIPTLYDNCKLIYYSPNKLIDYIKWERYYDMGYTVPIHDILSMKSGRQYLDIKKNKDKNILEGTPLYDGIYKLKANQILLNSIGEVKIDEKTVKQGLIDATRKNASYSLEVYDGTYFYNYDVVANMHVFRAYELFNSIEYTPLQDYFYEITIPEYFVNGYYMIDGLGMMRLVRGKEWNIENTDFNEQILYPEIKDKILKENMINDISEVAIDSMIIQDMSNPESEYYTPPYVYSSYKPLNRFTTNIPGVLGYVDPNEEKDETIDEEEEAIKERLQESKVSTFNLFFPKGKSCMVTIQSPTMEAMGTIDVSVGNKVHKLVLDRLNGTYSTTFKGTDEVGVLTIKGLYNSYDIKLVNCSQATDEQIKEYSSQSSRENTPDVENSTESTEETQTGTDTNENNNENINNTEESNTSDNNDIQEVLEDDGNDISEQ